MRRIWRWPGPGDPLRPLPRHVVALEGDGPLAGFQEARNGLQQRCLAGPIPASDEHDLPGADPERDVLEHHRRPVGHGDVFYTEHASPSSLPQ